MTIRRWWPVVCPKQLTHTTRAQWVRDRGFSHGYWWGIQKPEHACGGELDGSTLEDLDDVGK